MELDWNLPTTRYSTKWRTRRRLFHQYFNQHEIAKYRHVQLHECRTFLGRLLDSQMDLGENIRLFVLFSDSLRLTTLNCCHVDSTLLSS